MDCNGIEHMFGLSSCTVFEVLVEVMLLKCMGYPPEKIDRGMVQVRGFEYVPIARKLVEITRYDCMQKWSGVVKVSVLFGF